MNWNIPIKGYRNYIRLEKSLSENSIEAYQRDVEKLYQFVDYYDLGLNPNEITIDHLMKSCK